MASVLSTYKFKPLLCTFDGYIPYWYIIKLYLVLIQCPTCSVITLAMAMAIHSTIKSRFYFSLLVVLRGWKSNARELSIWYIVQSTIYPSLLIMWGSMLLLPWFFHYRLPFTFLPLLLLFSLSKLKRLWLCMYFNIMFGCLTLSTGKIVVTLSFFSVGSEPLPRCSRAY